MDDKQYANLNVFKKKMWVWQLCELKVVFVWQLLLFCPLWCKDFNASVPKQVGLSIDKNKQNKTCHPPVWDEHTSICFLTTDLIYKVKSVTTKLHVLHRLKQYNKFCGRFCSIDFLTFLSLLACVQIAQKYSYVCRKFLRKILQNDQFDMLINFLISCTWRCILRFEDYLKKRRFKCLGDTSSRFSSNYF